MSAAVQSSPICFDAVLFVPSTLPAACAPSPSPIPCAIAPFVHQQLQAVFVLLLHPHHRTLYVHHFNCTIDV